MKTILTFLLLCTINFIHGQTKRGTFKLKTSTEKSIEKLIAKDTIAECPCKNGLMPAPYTDQEMMEYLIKNKYLPAGDPYIAERAYITMIINEENQIIGAEVSVNKPCRGWIPKKNTPKTIINASFPGGISLQDYTDDFYSLPEQVSANLKIARNIIPIRFWVEKDGSCTDIQILKSEEYDPLLKESLFNFLESMPKWNPGTVNGEVVENVIEAKLVVYKKVKTVYSWSVQAHFPLGSANFQKFFEENIDVPNLLCERSQRSRHIIPVTFKVSKNGVCSDFKILKEYTYDFRLASPTLTVLKKMPNWIPRKVNGKANDAYIETELIYECK